MSFFNVQNFQAQVLGRGLAKTNRFEVFIQNPTPLRLNRESSNETFTPIGRLLALSPISDQAEISLLCEQAAFPFLNIQTKPYRIYGPTYPRPVVSDYGGEGVALTFHLDRSMKVKTFFDNWMQTTVAESSYNVRYKRDYATTVEIKQLDELDNITYQIVLEDAFPRSMNLVELNQASQNQTHRLTVLFAYRNWSRR
jgi:hypothetical protein